MTSRHRAAASYSASGRSSAGRRRAGQRSPLRAAGPTGAGRRRCPRSGSVEDPLPAPAALRVQRDLAAGVQDPQPAAADLDRHALADQAPRHAVGVAVDLDAAVGLNPTDQLADLLERRPAGERLQALRPRRAANRTIGGSPVVPWTRMSATSRVQRSRWASNAAQLAKLPAGDRVALDVADAALVLALGPRPVRRAGPRAGSPNAWRTPAAGR